MIDQGKPVLQVTGKQPSVYKLLLDTAFQKQHVARTGFGCELTGSPYIEPPCHAACFTSSPVGMPTVRVACSLGGL